MFEKLNALSAALESLHTNNAPQESINAVVSAISDENARVLKEYARKILAKALPGREMGQAIFALDGWQVTSCITSFMFRNRIPPESVSAEMIDEIFREVNAKIVQAVDNVIAEEIKIALDKQQK